MVIITRNVCSYGLTLVYITILTFSLNCCVHIVVIVYSCCLLGCLFLVLLVSVAKELSLLSFRLQPPRSLLYQLT